ncbi:ComEC/Rec2 family competence protein [Streptomyces sp. WMMC500]|uniref:ComEC/Rec2 family competence protein n=1 Tax=Streptomyces sp. WMMC500 TaxID=3015154 RepID=UPI00248BC6D1|nr:ComEC/Rec2 family competence protein [Streptomyces sp. WMMC500]WBB64664.1 ComEC/Rec2 family competence protein [Streptomyces sp. WMMC500]
MAAWAAAALALGREGAAVPVACALATAAGLALLAAARRRGRRHRPRPVPRAGGAVRPVTAASSRVLAAGAAALLCGAAGAGAAALHGADLHRGPLPAVAERYGQATVEVEVTSDPRLTRPQVRGPAAAPAAVLVRAEARLVTVRPADTSPVPPNGPATDANTATGTGTSTGTGSGTGTGTETGVGAAPPASVTVPPPSVPAPPASVPPPTAGSASRPSAPEPTAPAAAGPPGPAAAGAPQTTRVRTPVLVLVQPRDSAARRAWLGLLPSTRLRVEARVSPDSGGGRAVGAVLRVAGPGPPDVVRGPGDLQRAAGALRGGLREATDGLTPDARALLPGLVVGDTSRIPADLQDAFHATDLTHLLAVSGANLTIVLALLVGPPHLAARAERRGLAPRLGIPLRATALLGGLLTLGFVVVCRPEPSVLRAAACGLITLLALGTGRRRSLLPALAAAVLLLVLYDPWLAREYGFLLSVLATAALLTLAPRWSAALRARRVPPRLAEALAAAGAAQAVCAPVVAVLAARVSLVAIPCNLLAEFAVAPATVLGFAALAVALPAMPAAELLATPAGWAAEWIAGVARTGAALPGATYGWPGGWYGGLALAAVTPVLLLGLRRLARRRWLCVACVLLALLAVLRPVPLTRVLTGWPPAGWRLVACDVGQGDALALAAGDGQAVVVDTGPDPALVDRCLRDLGVRRIPLLVLTHFHEDHVAGLAGVLRGRAVGAIQVGGLDEPPGQAAAVRRTAAAAGVPVIRARPGERRRVGGLTWQVVWPAAGAPPPAEPNDASVTLLVRTAGLTVFLPGDLEPPAQRALLTAVPELSRVDVLKVPHHGSAYQDHELLRRLKPRFALVSAGTGNPYGHPAPRTVAALRAQGAAVLRTDEHGPLALTAEGDDDRTPAATVGGK